MYFSPPSCPLEIYDRTLASFFISASSSPCLPAPGAGRRDEELVIALDSSRLIKGVSAVRQDDTAC